MVEVEVVSISSLVWMVANILIMLAVAGRMSIVGEVKKMLKPKRFFRIVTFEIIIINTHNNQHSGGRGERCDE